MEIIFLLYQNRRCFSRGNGEKAFRKMKKRADAAQKQLTFRAKSRKMK